MLSAARQHRLVPDGHFSAPLTDYADPDRITFLMLNLSRSRLEHANLGRHQIAQRGRRLPERRTEQPLGEMLHPLGSMSCHVAPLVLDLFVLCK